MNKFFSTTMIAAALFAGAAHADEIVSETRSIDGRSVKVVLDGVIDLKLKQGPAALVVSGDKRYVPRITVTQSGDTLRIGTDLNGVHLNNPKLRAELTLPQVRELVSAGVGSAEMNGFSGDDLRLSLEGAGAVKVNSQYRKVDARLTGVGSMTVNAGDTDKVELNLKGAGQITISGQSKSLHAQLGGIGSLDAKQLQSESLDAEMTGLGSASFYAKNSANLRLSGMGSATVYGKPAARNATARGLGSVAWN
jgi:hypothetical protein